MPQGGAQGEEKLLVFGSGRNSEGNQKLRTRRSTCTHVLCPQLTRYSESGGSSHGDVREGGSIKNSRTEDALG